MDPSAYSNFDIFVVRIMLGLVLAVLAIPLAESLFMPESRLPFFPQQLFNNPAVIESSNNYYPSLWPPPPPPVERRVMIPHAGINRRRPIYAQPHFYQQRLENRFQQREPYSNAIPFNDFDVERPLTRRKHDSEFNREWNLNAIVPIQVEESHHRTRSGTRAAHPQRSRFRFPPMYSKREMSHVAKQKRTTLFNSGKRKLLKPSSAQMLLIFGNPPQQQHNFVSQHEKNHFHERPVRTTDSETVKESSGSVFDAPTPQSRYQKARVRIYRKHHKKQKPPTTKRDQLKQQLQSQYLRQRRFIDRNPLTALMDVVGFPSPPTTINADQPRTSTTYDNKIVEPTRCETVSVVSRMASSPNLRVWTKLFKLTGLAVQMEHFGRDNSKIGLVAAGRSYDYIDDDGSDSRPSKRQDTQNAISLWRHLVRRKVAAATVAQRRNVAEETVSSPSIKNLLIFAVDNKAFARLPSELMLSLLRDKRALEALLQYHVVVSQEIPSIEALTPGQSFAVQPLTTNEQQKTLPPLQIQRQRAGNLLTANCVPLKSFHGNAGTCRSRENATNFYVVDDLLLPPVVSMYQLLHASPNFYNFCKLLSEVGLDTVLDDSERVFTIFAPDDDAFVRQRLTYKDFLKSSAQKLRRLLMQHIVPDERICCGGIPSTADAVNYSTMNKHFLTLAGNDNFDLESISTRFVTARPALMKEKKMQRCEQIARNGVIIAIDDILIPPA